MELFKQKILKEAEVHPGGIIKVDGFLNHRMDIDLIDKIGNEFYNYFNKYNITKILTIEASGIGIACLAARYFKVPIVFAKKSDAKNLSSDTYTSEVFSYTKGKSFLVRVDKRYITPEDRVLIIDDFLANGCALLGLIDIVKQSNATVCGAGICIEKAFQSGGDNIRKMGIDLYSLAILDVDKDGKIIFVDK